MAVTYTEGRIKMTADNDASASDHYLVKSITWTGAANGNALVVQDQDGFDLWVAAAETGALEMSKTFDPPQQVKQVVAETLGGGTLYIYI